MSTKHSFPANPANPILRGVVARMSRHADECSVVETAEGGRVLLARDGNGDTPDVALYVYVNAASKGFTLQVQHDGVAVGLCHPPKGLSWASLERLFLGLTGWEPRS